MALYSRKLLPGETVNDQKTYSCYMCYICPDECFMSPPPPLTSPEPGRSRESSRQGGMSMLLLIMLCVLGGALLFLSYFTIIRFRSRLRRARRRNAAAPETGQDFLDENQGPVLDHPVWHIRTVGLPPAVIEAIPVFRYVKGDGLIEGSDCSVCLGEFREDETLRLLPKCSHAFHLPCIDKWLASHKNCPVCRAPILSAAANTVAVAVTSAELRPPEENRAVNRPETETLETMERIGVGQNSVSIPDLDEDKTTTHLFFGNGGNLRVLSDLTDHHRTAACGEQQPAVRRSSSMDNFPSRGDSGEKEEGSSGSKVERTNSDATAKSSGFYGFINGKRSFMRTRQ